MQIHILKLAGSLARENNNRVTFTVTPKIPRRNIPPPVVTAENLLDLEKSLENSQSLSMPAAYLSEKRECIIHGEVEKEEWYGWNIRYLVVVPPYLYRFQRSNDETMREAVDLSQISVLMIGDVYIHLDQSTLGQGVIVYRFQTRAERNRWFKALMQASKGTDDTAANATATTSPPSTPPRTGGIAADCPVEMVVRTTKDNIIYLEFLRQSILPFFRTLMIVKLKGTVTFWDDPYRDDKHFLLSDEGEAALLAKAPSRDVAYAFLKQYLDDLLVRKKLDHMQRYTFFLMGYTTSCQVLKVPPCRALLEDAVQPSDEIQVDIRGTQLGDRSAVAVARGIRYLHNISSFLARSAFTTYKGITPVLMALSECRSLSVLDLSGNNLSATPIVAALLQILRSCPITSLLLATCKLSVEQVVGVTSAVSKMKTIQVLDISHNPLCKQACLNLSLPIKAKLLRKCRAWESGVNESMIKALFHAIGEEAHWCELDFGSAGSFPRNNIIAPVKEDRVIEAVKEIPLNAGVKTVSPQKKPTVQTPIICVQPQSEDPSLKLLTQFQANPSRKIGMEVNFRLTENSADLILSDPELITSVHARRKNLLDFQELVGATQKIGDIDIPEEDVQWMDTELGRGSYAVVYLGTRFSCTEF